MGLSCAASGYVDMRKVKKLKSSADVNKHREVKLKKGSSK